MAVALVALPVLLIRGLWRRVTETRPARHGEQAHPVVHVAGPVEISPRP